MKVNLMYDSDLNDDEIVLKISPNNKKADTIMKAFGEKDIDLIAGKLNDRIYLIELKDIECFYTYDNGVVFFSKGSQYKINEKLFELQQKYETRNFLRISKSVIINIEGVEYLVPDFNKKLIFKMNSGRQEYSSRSYYNEIKNKLGV